MCDSEARHGQWGAAPGFSLPEEGLLFSTGNQSLLDMELPCTADPLPVTRQNYEQARRHNKIVTYLTTNTSTHHGPVAASG